MMGGQVSMGFSALPSSLPYARAGKLRPLAVTGSKRSEAAPDIPTFVNWDIRRSTSSAGTACSRLRARRQTSSRG
jgi:tripartite-type tricarboxylate transporter receptor subunit TctC